MKIQDSYISSFRRGQHERTSAVELILSYGVLSSNESGYYSSIMHDIRTGELETLMDIFGRRLLGMDNLDE